MELRQLRYFVAIVQCGSISRAALQLNVAQPALSLHVRNMEAELGSSLLFRTAKGVQPTEAGLILLRHARGMLDRLDEAEHEIRGRAAEPTGEVRLGVPSSMGQLLGVPPLVLAARERYPKVTLRVAYAMSGYVLDWLRIGRVDLGLLCHAVEKRELHATGLLAETLVLAGPVGMRSDGPQPPGDPVAFAALAALPLILPSPGHGLRDLLDDAAAAQGCASRATSTLMVPSSNWSAAASATRSSRRTPSCARSRRAGSAPGPSTRRGPARSTLSGAAEAIADLCGAVLRDLVRWGAWPMARMLHAT